MFVDNHLNGNQRDGKEKEEFALNYYKVVFFLSTTSKMTVMVASTLINVCAKHAVHTRALMEGILMTNGQNGF